MHLQLDLSIWALNLPHNRRFNPVVKRMLRRQRREGKRSITRGAVGSHWGSSPKHSHSSNPRPSHRYRHSSLLGRLDRILNMRVMGLLLALIGWRGLIPGVNNSSNKLNRRLIIAPLASNRVLAWHIWVDLNPL